MGAWKHRLSQIDPEGRTALCAHCGPVTIRLKRTTWRCNKKDRRERSDERPARKPLIPKRECAMKCGAKISHPRQLDVHHIDGDHNNNDPSNLCVLCANCHRLVHA